jgi:hypothetical protein
LPAVAGALAAVVVVGGAWLLLREGDDSGDSVVAVATTAAATGNGGDEDSTSETTADTDGTTTTSVRDTEDTTNGTTITDVPISDLPVGAPDTFVAVTSDTFELVVVDSRTGEVIEQLGSWDLGGGDEAPLQALQFVELAPNGTIYVDDCCEPAYGTTFVVSDSFDPATTTQLSGIGPELSLDGSRLARSSQGSAVAISDAAGNELGSFGEPDFTGRITTALTWVDSSTLVVNESDDGGTINRLRILDVSDPNAPVLIAERADDPGLIYLAADVRADGNILVVRRTGAAGDVIAEVIDTATGEVVVDFDLPDDVYTANYDAAGRFVLTVRENGDLEWYGAGQRGTLASGFISADW